MIKIVGKGYKYFLLQLSDKIWIWDRRFFECNCSGLPVYWDAVNASKNDNTIFQDTITEKRTHFRAQYIPRIYHKLLGKLYNIRTTVERKNSNDVVGYDRSKIPARGSLWAKTYVSISNIATLLTALTAFKIGRHDLIRAPAAFRRLNI